MLPLKDMKKLLILLGFLVWIPVNADYSQPVISDFWNITPNSSSSFYRIGQLMGTGMYGTTTGFSFTDITETWGGVQSFGGNIIQCDSNENIPTLLSNLNTMALEDSCVGGTLISGLSVTMPESHTGELVFNYGGQGPDLDPEKYTYFVLFGITNGRSFTIQGDSSLTATTLVDFSTNSGSSLNFSWILYGSGSATPQNSQITSVISPTGILPTASTTVDFEFTYYNGIPLVSFAFAEVRDITNGINYATELKPPNASGGNTYQDSLVLEAGAFHMWRPILDFGTSSPRIYGSWTTFDVLTPSAGFTPDPVFWGNTDPWDTNASSTAGLAETTCQGISNPIILASCRVVAFLFIPPSFAYQFIENLVLQFYSTFPFNLLALGIDTAWDIQQFDWLNYNGTTTLFALTFSNATSTAQLGDIDLVSSKTIQDAIPSTVASLIRNTLTIGIYVMFVMSITFSARAVFNRKT